MSYSEALTREGTATSLDFAVLEPLLRNQAHNLGGGTATTVPAGRALARCGICWYVILLRTWKVLAPHPFVDSLAVHIPVLDASADGDRLDISVI